ncbi:uncharacterized protein K452DRAFT_308351 [Aplosporella prunicola CBS 121167]|uniref:DUF6590 domain-containing protein n=1 Tax=Aplosporella prunicola CBS 121167 TaxID=1176127 RepID=A0A6A6BCJ7_9PEZI|nr:uncharacterized protein K452DRAFT_308351 [Aplosporella prunicola CBS 121167]KAF2141929.1 hypothetical protein K452DRAFT_308351 [Aplosporella prunicola CBS 121167]
MPREKNTGGSKPAVSIDSVTGGVSGLKIQGTKYNPSQVGASTAYSRFAGTNNTGYNPRPYADRPHTADEFEQGTIIRTPHLVPRLNRNPPSGAESRHVLQSAVGDILIKERYFIVLVKFPTHMLAVPITSCGDRGIGHLREDIRSQYMAIRALEDTKYVNTTKYPALVVEWKKFDLMATSYVQTTSPVTVSYNFKIEDVGYLEGKSYDTLAANFRGQLNQAFKKP